MLTPINGDTNGHAGSGSGNNSGGPVHGVAVAEPAVTRLRTIQAGAPGAAGFPGGEEAPVFGNLLEVFWQRKWVVLLCMVAGLLAGVVYLARATPIYRSAAKVYLDQAGPQLLGNPMMGFNSGQTLATQAQVLTSTTILARALELPAMKQAVSLWDQDNPLGYVREALDVQADEADILVISMDSPEARDNAIVVNSVIEAFSEYHKERRKTTAAEVLKTLQKEKFQLNEELKRLTDEMLAFQRRHGTASASAAEGDGPASQRLAQLSSTLTAAELRTLNAKMAYTSAVEAGNDLQALELLAATDPAFDGFEVKVKPGASREAQTLEALRRERDYLVNVNGLGAGHRSVATLDAQIADLESAMAGGGETPIEDPVAFYRGLLKQRWENATATEAELRTLFQEQEGKTVEQNKLAAEYTLLASAARRAERQLELSDQRIRELNLNEDYDLINVTVLEPAEAGLLPVKPQRAQTMAVALVMSLMLGLGLAFLQELMDDRLRSSEEITAMLGLPVLGVVPAVNEKSGASCGRIVESQPHSVAAEAFRTVRTAVQFSAAGASAKVLVVTSPAPGDGKTTVASNMAIAFAQAGRKTLLIDADCRKPRQHRVFGLEAERGLASVLLKTQKGKVSSPIQKTEVARLDLLPCGPVPSNPAEMLNGSRFTRLIKQLSPHYDQIVIDSPPTVPVSDARIIAASADGYILVLRAGRSGRKMAKHAAELLTSVGGRAVGLVINGVTGSWGSYSYYSRYGFYQYGYGEYRDGDGAPRALRGAARAALPVEAEAAGGTGADVVTGLEQGAGVSADTSTDGSQGKGQGA